MPVPGYQEFMLPLLQMADDGKDHSNSEALEYLSDFFKLSAEERGKLLPSGTQTMVYNRIGWARTYMTKAGLLERSRRSHFHITERGRTLLKEKPDAINLALLGRYPEFVAFRFSATDTSAIADASPVAVEESGATPEEVIERLHSKINLSLGDDLLSSILRCKPEFFEKLVVALLLKMGYGGSAKEAAEVIGGSGDEGIDGIIKEDKLGLDTIYIQAKRWKGQVGRPEIQKFAGALLGKKAKKGIFITTSAFSSEAADYAKGVENRIILIDGIALTQLMIEYGIGVSVDSTYVINKIDSDYFSDE
jgi:restriction system protein